MREKSRAGNERGDATLIKLAILLSAALALVSSSEGNVAELGRSIPSKIMDWQAAGQDRVFDTKTVYDYLDGGAEVYLAFDLKQVFVRKYQGPAGDEMALDIYEFGSPEEAFGVFSSERQDPAAGIGQDSEYGLGLLRFWQGRCLVSITASGDEKRAEGPMLALGRAVAPLLGPDGGFPGLLGVLPPAGLKKDRTCYFHSAVNLNNRFFVSSENILNLDKRTACVLAEYAGGGAETPRLLLVRYPDAGLAAAAYDSFLHAYLPEAKGEGSAKTERGTWTMARLKADCLAVVFDAPSQDFAANLQSAVRYPSK
jgi:hypothetical protein